MKGRAKGCRSMGDRKKVSRREDLSRCNEKGIRWFMGTGRGEGLSEERGVIA